MPKVLSDFLKYEYKNGAIYQGDCLEIMPLLKSQSIDLVLTDPPYNATDIGPKKRIYNNLKDKMRMPDLEYQSFCNDWFTDAMVLSRKLVFTPGIANTHNYPQPFWQICWHKPAAVSFNRMGGFNAWEPIFCYGEVTKAKIGQDYIKVNTLNLKKGPESEHPCPKPLDLWKWLILHYSEPNSIVLDPFLGSGTTAVACKELGRRFIGIEISEAYCKIAKKRLSQEMLFS